MSVFLLIAVVWPLRVREFSSTSGVQVKVSKELVVNEQQLKTTVLNSLARLTTDERLDQAVADVGRYTTITSNVLSNVDRSVLHDRLRIRMHQTNEPTQIAITLELVGNGSADEIQLVNQLASGLFSELGVEAERSRVQIARQKIVDELSRIDQLVGNQIQDIESGLLPQLESVDVQLNSVISLLEREQFETAAQNQVNSQRPAGSTSTAEQGSVADGGSQRVRNTHFASATQQVDSAAVSRLRGVSNQRAILSADQLKRALESVRFQHKELFNGVQGLGAEASGVAPVTLLEISRASTSLPIGGMPTMAQIILLLMSSLLVGGAVAALLDPSVSFRPFASQDELTESTRLPVIAAVSKIPRKSEPSIGIGQKGLAVVLRACEIFLMLVALLLVGSALLKSGFLPEFLNNPFHAAARYFS